MEPAFCTTRSDIGIDNTVPLNVQFDLKREKSLSALQGHQLLSGYLQVRACDVSGIASSLKIKIIT